MRSLFSVLFTAFACVAPASAEWLSWRGPGQNGSTREPAPVRSWSLDGENLAWHVPIGGRTTPIVTSRFVYLNTPVGEGASLRERVICLSVADGKTVWEHSFNVYHTDIVENRVGWTALAVDSETGNVYCHGTGGDLLCFEGATGKVIWQRALTEEFGRFSGYGGRLYTPVIEGEFVILGFLNSGWGAHARLGHRFAAFDKKTGEIIWWAEPGGQPMDTTYATPVSATINGRRLLICPAADGWVYALYVGTGETVWKYRLAARPLNTSPVVDGDYVYITHSEENFDTTEMGRAACIDGTRTGEIAKDNGEIWRVDGIDVGYASPAVANGRLYVIDNSAKLTCLNARSGVKKWDFKLGRVGRGSPVVTSDGVIYASEVNGAFWILRDAGDSCEVLDKKEFEGPDRLVCEIQGSPAVCHGRVYFQTRYGTYCIGQKDLPSHADVPRPNAAAGDPGAAPLVRPADVQLYPGDSAAFVVPGGASSSAQWTMKGVDGGIAGHGDGATFTAPSESRFSSGVVGVKLGERAGEVRVRICPKPPFEEDFESYAVDSVPPAWLNVVRKTRIIEEAGNKVLMHLAEDPKPAFMRIRTYMTPPIGGGYTIEADVRGGRKKTAVAEFWPDMGVVNSRYELLLMGDDPDDPRVRLTTWPAQPRLQKDVPFTWQPDVWYRMKLQVSLNNGRGILRGKVWPREEQEPSAWTIELEDPIPNTEGSPALYGYANGTTAKSKGASIYFDNVKVYKDE